MPTTFVVVAGSPGLLAAHLVVRLGTWGCRIGYLGPPGEHARFADLARWVAADRSDGGDPGPCVERLELEALGGAEIWYFRSPIETLPVDDTERVALDALRGAGIDALNLVTTPFSGGQAWRWLLPLRAGDAPGDLSVTGGVRHFRTALTIGTAPASDIAQEGVLHVLTVLFALKAEFEARAADLFDYRALRCPIAPDAPINILPVEVAAAMVLAIADRPPDGGTEHIIAATTDLDGETFLETVGSAYDVGLLGGVPAPGATGGTSLDTLFERRLAGFAMQAALSPHADDAPPDGPAFDGARFAALVGATRDRQAADQRAMEACTAAAPDWSDEVARDGHPLRYNYVGESGAVLVLINALGQGQEAWSRLVAHLSRRFRVLSWDLRGLAACDPVMTITDHVDDLAAILDHARADRAHLVAWCTGPKIAAAFANRFPARVASLTLLNTTIKSGITPAALDTPYERNFESLCRALDQRPAMAGPIRASLTASADVAEGDLLGDDAGAADSAVMLAMNRALRRPVLRPFDSDATLLRYAAQVTDFWHDDASISLKALSKPVLILAAEYDSVATAKSSIFVADVISQTTTTTISGATHYFLYDRADHTARLIEWFASRVDAKS